MPQQRIQRELAKESINEKLYGGKSAFKKYLDFFVGNGSWGALLQYELYAMVLAPLPGAAGLMLRKLMVPGMLGSCGNQCLWGRDIQIRHPGKVRVGDRVAIDDHCLLDARAEGGITLEDDVAVARDCVLMAKNDEVVVGERSIIGNQAQLSSTGGIYIGKDVGIGGQSYIGGGLYHTERTDVPMLQQGLYTRGPVIIGDDVWIGAGVRILDGVKIGKGSFIGAGAVIFEDVPEYSKVMPFQKMIILPRAGQQKAAATPVPSRPVAVGSFAKRDKILACVFEAIAELNLQLPPGSRLSPEESTILFDSRSGDGLDSLGLINFIVICEQKIEEEIGSALDLTSVVTNTDNGNPFASVADLADTIAARLSPGSGSTGTGGIG